MENLTTTDGTIYFREVTREDMTRLGRIFNILNDPTYTGSRMEGDPNEVRMEVIHEMIKKTTPEFVRSVLHHVVGQYDLQIILKELDHENN